MKNHIELSRDEIKKIIAEHFSVSEDKVAVAVEPKSVGYGKGEHYQYVPYAVVEKVD